MVPPGWLLGWRERQGKTNIWMEDWIAQAIKY